MEFNGLHTDEEINSCNTTSNQLDLPLTDPNATALDAQPSASNEDSSSSE